jgi:hypothetical protein
METWAWLIAYLLGFALLQLYLYRYFMNGESTTDTSTTATPGFEGGATVEHQGNDELPDDSVACQQCGAYNESHATFTFCKHCGARL